MDPNDSYLDALSSEENPEDAYQRIFRGVHSRDVEREYEPEDEEDFVCNPFSP